jgi:glycosyltransferase involved in cell wall biosynthesis
MEGVSPKKIYLIHHGFDLPFFYTISADRQKQVQQKYNPDNRHPVIGVVSRYTRWKGIIYIINAFTKLLEKHPEALLVLANAKGEDKEIQDAIKKLPEKNYVEIVFENDNAALFKMFDVFVHVPIDAEIEAFGQIYIEALAVGVPCVFTLSGVSREFVKDGENALVVDFHNEEQIYHAVDRILEDADLRNKLVENGKKSIEKNFSLQLFIEKLETIYSL